MTLLIIYFFNCLQRSDYECDISFLFYTHAYSMQISRWDGTVNLKVSLYHLVFQWMWHLYWTIFLVRFSGYIVGCFGNVWLMKCIIIFIVIWGTMLYLVQWISTTWWLLVYCMRCFYGMLLSSFSGWCARTCEDPLDSCYSGDHNTGAQFGHID